MLKVKTTPTFQSAADIAIAEFLARGGVVEQVKTKPEPRGVTAK